MACVENMARVEIVHELDKRLRLRILSDPDHFAQTEVALRQLPGVGNVRANRACASLTLVYDGRPEVRDSILATAGRVAKACSVPRTRIERIVREELGISGDTAVRLGKFFKTSPEFWMNLQTRYEVLTAQRKAADALASIEPYEPRAA